MGALLIHPEAFYPEPIIRRRLGLSDSALAKARKSGALKHVKRGQAVIYRGDWLRAWLEADPDCIAAAPEPVGASS